MDFPLALDPYTGCHCFNLSFGKVFSVEFTKAVFIVSTQLKIVPGTCPLSFRIAFSQVTLFHLQHFLKQGIWKHWTSGLSMGSVPRRGFRAAFNRDLRPWVTPVEPYEGPLPLHLPVNGHRDRAQPHLSPSIFQVLDPSRESRIWEYKADGAWVCCPSWKEEAFRIWICPWAGFPFPPIARSGGHQCLDQNTDHSLSFMESL